MSYPRSLIHSKPEFMAFMRQVRPRLRSPVILHRSRYFIFYHWTAANIVLWVCRWLGQPTYRVIQNARDQADMWESKWPEYDCREKAINHLLMLLPQ